MSSPHRGGTGAAATAAGGLLVLLACLSGGATPEPPARSGEVVSLATASPPHDPGAPSVRMERTWPVMGTLLHVTAWAADSTTGRDALRSANSEVSRVDSLMSTYRPDSEISEINRAAGGDRWVRVSGETAAVLDASLRWARATGGAFDPTAGPLARAWGFHQGEPGIPDPGVADSVRGLVGWDRVRWRPRERSVRLPEAGMRLDFGAIAKGYALDEAVAAMREAGAGSGMVDLGGNLRVFGTPPGDRQRWLLGIRHPRPGGSLLGTVVLDSGSVATSGDGEQFFVAGGTRYSHIMDPRSGRPARGVAQVTVVAPRGMAADALATSLFVLGPEAGRARLGVHLASDVAVLWVRDPGPGSAVDRAHLECVPAPGVRFRVPLPDSLGGTFRCGGDPGP